MNFRDYLATTVLVVLLLWGPIDRSWPAWLAIRIGYLIVVPILVWLFVGWLWDYFLLSEALGEFLGRVLSTIIFGGMVILAILEATAKTHIGNTMWVRTRDGMEAVGDPVIVNGPDWRTVFVLAILAALFLLFGVFRIGKKSEKRVSR